MKGEKKKIQSYALNEQDELVHAKDVDKSLKQKFYCLHCKDEMICKQGKVRRPHFAHKTAECSYDQYLHSLAKRRISEWFNKAEKVIVEIPTIARCSDYENCKWKSLQNTFNSIYDYESEEYTYEQICKKTVHKQYNLKQWFYTCEEERDFVTPNGQRYRADILCHNKKDDSQPLFIEICVTHPCEPEKINSGIRIIEINIESEEDIDSFISEPIHKSTNVSFYGFKPREEVCEIKDEVLLKKYIHYPSGKVFIDYQNFTCKNYDKKRWGDFEITIGYDDSGIPEPFTFTGGFFAVASAVTQRYFPDFRNCSICKWKAYDDLMNVRICKLYKKCGTNRICIENNPLECTYFRINQEECLRLRQEFEEEASHETIDVWKKE